MGVGGFFYGLLGAPPPEIAGRKAGKPVLRVHCSFIAHLGKRVDIEENNLVVGGRIIPISRADKAESMNRLNLW